MEYLHGRFGDQFMTDLHLGPRERSRLAGGVARRAPVRRPSRSTLSPPGRRWSRSTRPLDDGFTLTGGTPAEFRTPTLHAEINWDNDQAFAGPGVPANGSDYVRLRDATDAYLDVGDVDSVEFNGASKLAEAARPVEGGQEPAEGRPLQGAVLGQGRQHRPDDRRRVQVGNGVLEVDTGVGHRGGLRLRLRPGLDRRREEVQERPLHRFDRRATRAGLRRQLRQGSSPSGAT